MLLKNSQNQAIFGKKECFGNKDAGKSILTSPIAGIVVALLIAVLMIWLIYPPSFLHGRGAYFESGDATQHVTGWLFYAHDAWHFPLLHTSLLNYPQGTLIAFTDSIPLAALLFKPLATWLPAQFHYIGLWHAVAYLLQALGAVALIRALGVRHLPGALAAAAMSVMWPTLYWRMGHTSLMTHGLILLALALYFSGRKASDDTIRTGLLLVAVSVAALLVHPYLFAMCYPIFIAYMVDQGLAGNGWVKQGGQFVLSLIIIAVIGAALGYLEPGNTVTAGFGQHSLNLIAPFCGGMLVACPSDAVAFPGENFTYFGAGALVIILAGATMRAGSSVSLVRRYPGLSILMVLFLLYAISPTVRLGSHVAISELYKIPLSLDMLTGTFRVSARFFWPVAYLIFFGALAAVFRTRPLLTAAILVLALPLQWIDTASLRSNMTNLASTPESDDLSNWDMLAKGVRAIHVYPAYTCGDVSGHEYLLAQRLAARYNTKIDTGHIARLKVNCETNDRKFDGAFAPDELYLLPAKQLENMKLNLPAGFRKAASRGECAETTSFIVCKAGTDPTYWSNDKIVIHTITGFPNSSATWNGAELQGLTGRISENYRVANGNDAPGFLTFGPYARLSLGRYQFKLTYDSAQAPDAKAGWWDVVLLDDNAKPMRVAQGVLHGSAGMAKEISGDFNIEGGARKVEIRTYFNGGHQLRVQRLTITSESADSVNTKSN